jgi:hypothetical protein
MPYVCSAKLGFFDTVICTVSCSANGNCRIGLSTPFS